MHEKRNITLQDPVKAALDGRFDVETYWFDDDFCILVRPQSRREHAYVRNREPMGAARGRASYSAVY